ncbi:MAG: sugar transferase [Clostridiales bacterium]|nr:sugar transferase [Clostridiales bacterium]
MYKRFGKRSLDILLSLLGLVILSPIFALASLAVKLSSPGPVFFRQKRVGKNKVPFEIWKFRTMRLDAPKDVPTHLLKDAERYITPVGKVLRATSIDELPQFANVFWGQMSLIGPRPALWNQDDLVALRDQYRANDVLPGMSGWAQVNGRDELSLEKKARRDGEYAQNISFRLDMKCLLLTFVKVFNREGIAEGKEGKHYSVLRVEGKK